MIEAFFFIHPIIVKTNYIYIYVYFTPCYPPLSLSLGVNMTMRVSLSRSFFHNPRFLFSLFLRLGLSVVLKKIIYEKKVSCELNKRKKNQKKGKRKKKHKKKRVLCYLTSR